LLCLPLLILKLRLPGDGKRIESKRPSAEKNKEEETPKKEEEEEGGEGGGAR
jgi:hypothetical protein